MLVHPQDVDQRLIGGDDNVALDPLAEPVPVYPCGIVVELFGEAPARSLHQIGSDGCRHDERPALFARRVGLHGAPDASSVHDDRNGGRMVLAAPEDALVGTCFIGETPRAAHIVRAADDDVALRRGRSHHV